MTVAEQRVTSGTDCRLHIVADPETVTVTLQSRTGGVKANKDGKDEAALILLKANVKLSNPKIVAALKDAGISRSVEWVRKRKLELLESTRYQQITLLDEETGELRVSLYSVSLA